MERKPILDPEAIDQLEQFITGSIDKPISKAHGILDTDLARDNRENVMTATDLEDL